MSVESRFWSKVEIRGEDECWPWQGNTKPEYGRFRRPSGSLVGSHIMAYELTNGKPPDGLDICHKCDNPPCCNPKHLFAGTTSDNIKDAILKGRLKMSGEFSPAAKLTDKQVEEIRSLSELGYSNKKLAEMYAVSSSHVCNLKVGRFRKKKPG